jgi:succinate dehydrogenase / fumarate reductase cytochrome b subunit
MSTAKPGGGSAPAPTANTSGARARRTTVALKILMAVSGALFVLYVVAHMYGNLKVFGGQAAFDDYAHHLRVLGEPLLPYSGFLWLFRVALVAALVGHTYAAFALWRRAGRARSTRYVVRQAGSVAFRSATLRWGGLALLLFVVFHLIQFTIVKVNVNSGVSAAEIGDSPYRLVVASFQVWWVVVIYLLALAALGLHLNHGVWSAAQTLGWTNSATARQHAKTAAAFLAALVVVGFALPPLAILFGVVE